MAQFLRSKQTGFQRDLSAGLDPQLFALDEIYRYGINAQTVAIAYDPVQSLVAVGTAEHGGSSGQVYVFGQKRVSCTFTLPRKASVKILQFVGKRLLCADSKHDLSIYSLETTHILTSYSPPSGINALATDPHLEHVLIGLQNGDVVAYDLDRQCAAPFKIPNLPRENVRSRVTPILGLTFHPRDIGTLLVTYSECAVVYSFQQNRAVKSFQYPNPRGGSLRLTHAVWHPSGTFLLTAHEDSSLVFWDVKSGKPLSTRSLTCLEASGPLARHSHTKTPLFQLAWCVKANLDETGLLIAGGRISSEAARVLTWIDLGPTPVYATSSWQALSDYFDKPKAEHLLLIPNNAAAIDFCLIPRASPHFNGAQDPIAVIAVLSSGEIATMSVPSGRVITPTNQLHVSLSFVHPFVNSFHVSFVDRSLWLGMVESRSQGPRLIKGGAESSQPRMRFANRNIIQAAHADGTIRLWDVGHGDEIENEDVVQVDLARAIGRTDNIDVTATCMSSVTGEMVVGLRSGEAVILRWNKNHHYGREISHSKPLESDLVEILDRADPCVKEGLLPLLLYTRFSAPISKVQTSDVGFICIASRDGHLSVIDLRGPAVIYASNVSALGAGQLKRQGGKRATQPASQIVEYVSVAEFSVLTLDHEDYSSILLFAGTTCGRTLTFKILPRSTGGYSVNYITSTTVTAEEPIVYLSTIKTDNGESASATQSAVNDLGKSIQIDAHVLAVTRTGMRLFKPPDAKGAHRSWDHFFCYEAAVVRFEAHTYAIVGVFGDGTTRAYSIPGLKEIGCAAIGDVLDSRRLSESVITPTGLIIGWTGPSEIVVLNVWGTGQTLSRSLDRLYNAEAVAPPRPTISNIQWMSGATHVTISDMEKLIGGPDRPPTKHMLEQLRSEEQIARNSRRTNSDHSSTAGPTSTSTGTSLAARQQAAYEQQSQNQEGYWAYMQRQVQERTQNLGLTGDSMDRLEDNSEGFANDINKFIKNQKKAAVKGCKFFLTLEIMLSPTYIIQLIRLKKYSHLKQAWSVRFYNLPRQSSQKSADPSSYLHAMLDIRKAALFFNWN